MKMGVIKLCLQFALCVAVLEVLGTPLDDYVNRPDPHYKYTFLKKYQGPGYEVHILNMTSQKWMTEADTDRPIWWHYLCIVIPEKIEFPKHSVMWIDAGTNNDNIPTLRDAFLDLVIALSVSTNTVTATLKQIPNQPITFLKDPSHKPRVEDHIIAWTWKTFLENPTNPEILLRMPMTKAAVRGMDTITEYTKPITGNTIEKFVVAGASKRGWTTWTAAAVDKRVIGFAPIVMDLLHMQKNIHHMYRAYGGWTFAFSDYYEVNITRQLDNPNFPKMQAVIDPITYNSRYATKPKLIISATGDEFFMPDDSHFYYKELKGTKFLRVIPNAEHSIAGHVISLMFDVRAFYLHLVRNTKFPIVSWVMSQTGTGGKITVTTDTPPTTVTVYHAFTLDDKRRDFRMVVLDEKTGKTRVNPVIWFEKSASKISETEYVAEMDRPASGWAGFFVELTFSTTKSSVLEITTEVCIVPDTFPFPDCHKDTCEGKLV